MLSRGEPCSPSSTSQQHCHSLQQHRAAPSMSTDGAQAACSSALPICCTALLGTSLPWNPPRASCAAHEATEKTSGLASGWTKSTIHRTAFTKIYSGSNCSMSTEEKQFNSFQDSAAVSETTPFKSTKHRVLNRSGCSHPTSCALADILFCHHHTAH